MKNWIPMESRMPPKLFLPITQKELDALFAKGVKTWFEDAQHLHAISVYLIWKLPKLKADTDKAAQITLNALTELSKQLNTPDTRRGFRELASSQVSKKQLQRGIELLEQYQIRLDPDQYFETPSPALSDGSFNPDFTIELTRLTTGIGDFGRRAGPHAAALNREQFKASRIIEGNDDDPVHIEGLGGTGKGYLIRSILHDLPAKHTVILAKTRPQLNAISKGVDGEVHKMLFGEYAKLHLILSGVGMHAVNGPHAKSSYMVSNASIARSMDIPQLGDFSPERLAGVMMSTITKYCSSDSTAIDHEHIPNHESGLNGTIKNQVIKYARAYWRELTTASHGERWQPVRHAHLIKWASLVDQMPSRDLTNNNHFEMPDLRFAVVDEAHDLTPAMAALLKNTGVLVRSFSDTYQRINGAPPKLSHGALKVHLHQSMRAGSEIERVLNPALLLHPRNKDGEGVIQGNHEIPTKLTLYDAKKIPSDPFAILCGTYFHVFEYIQRLVSQGARVALLPGTEYAFHQFGASLIRLYQGGTGQIASYDLARYKSWDQLRKTHGNSDTFLRIESMLRKGYSEADFANLQSKLSPVMPQTYIVARVEDTKNWQFPNVMVSKELMEEVRPEEVWRGSTADIVSERVSKVYLAMSRAERSLAIGKNYEGWLDSVKNLATVPK